MITPSQRYYRNAARKTVSIPEGMDRLVLSTIGRWRRRAGVKRRLRREARKVLKISAQRFKGLDEKELREEVIRLHGDARRGSLDVGGAREAMACLVVISERVLGMTPYEEQVMGALAIQQGLFAEMATGEGKTLTIALGSLILAWSGYPVHVITVNDYLAERDAESLRDFYRFAGVEVGFVTGKMEPDGRRDAYACGVVYTTSQELLADYLRDRLKVGEDQAPSQQLVRHLFSSQMGERGSEQVMRGIHTVIVDEADSVLIDEAVTPLIISRKHQADDFAECCRVAREIAMSLKAGRDFSIDHARNEIVFRTSGEYQIDRQRHRLSPIWRSPDRREELVRQALVAEEFFDRDSHYTILEGKVEIIDEFTGRLMPGRTWKQGLHQAIEAKEGITSTDPTETLASMSFQRFFRMFRHISGVSGTAWEAAGELWTLYRLAVVKIPTHRPCLRHVEPMAVFGSSDSKREAIIHDIEELHAQGRPVLVGTRTVEESEILAEMLKDRGVVCDVLNAVRHKDEADVVARAGKKGAVTIATNMAGRGTDVKIAGPELEIGGMHVILVDPNFSGRIDRQLMGRTARQGDPGSVRAYLSVDDELIARFLPKFMKKRLKLASMAQSVGYQRLALSCIRHAQKASDRLGASQRKSVLKMDTWVDEHLSFVPESRRM
ncbi:MAG: prepilin peptidase [Verrucomicrobiota bacterium]